MEHWNDPFIWSFVVMLVIGYLLVLVTSPAASAMRYGLMALWRHRSLLGLLVLFAVTAALVRELMEVWWVVRETPDWTRDLQRERLGFRFNAAPLLPALQGALQPAFQNTLGMFHCGVTTFPLSVPAALLFLINGRGVLSSLVRQLWRRDRWWTVPMVAFLGGAAVASLVKPWALSPWFPTEDVEWVIGREVLLWLAFAFEYALGVFVQVALALRILEWLRGMHFEGERFLHTVTRRFVVVWHWFWIIFVVSSLLFYLPPILGVVFGRSTVLPGWLNGDLLFALVLVPFAPVQALLIFHNYRLGEALAGSFRFMRQHPGTMAWIILLAWMHWMVLETFMLWLTASLGGINLFAWLARLLLAGAVAFLTGWLFATWITLFKQIETGHGTERNWLKV